MSIHSLYSDIPALIQMLNPTRDDLFVVLTEKNHFVVQIDEILYGADDTIGCFQRGYVELDKASMPTLLTLAAQRFSSTCHPLQCVLDCPACGGVMQPVENSFVCKDCNKTI